MATELKHILRIHDTYANLITNLKDQQIAFATDSNQILWRDGTDFHTFYANTYFDGVNTVVNTDVASTYTLTTSDGSAVGSITNGGTQLMVVSADVDLLLNGVNKIKVTAGDFTGTVDKALGADVDGNLVKFDVNDTDTTISESTGVLTGGALSTGAGASEYSISDGTGQLVDGAGVITPVSWSGKSNITPTNLATNLISWVGIDSAGNVVEQVTAFTRAQARTIIILGVVVHVNLTTVDAVNNEQHIAYNAMTSTYDLAESIGFFNVEGNVFSANGANRNIDQSSGKLFKMGSNYGSSPVDNPHVRPLPSLTALSFQYRFSDGSNGVTGIAIDPTTLDDGAGGTTNVPNNQFSVQRIYIFTSGNVKIQRGVESFPNLDSALAGYSSEAYVTEPSIEANGLLRGFLVLRQDVNDLTDTAKAVFISAPKFGEGGGSTGASASALDLQTAYNNSIDPEILTDATRGPLTLKRGSVADTDNVIEVQNGSGTNTFEVTGEGDLDISGDATIDQAINLTPYVNSTPTINQIWARPNGQRMNGGFGIGSDPVANTISAPIVKVTQLLHLDDYPTGSTTDGDIWRDGTDIKTRVGGVTKTFTLV